MVRWVIGIVLLALATIFSLIGFTTPATIHPLGLLLFFVAVYVVVTGFFLVVILLCDYILKRGYRYLTGRYAQTGDVRRAYAFASMLAFGPVIYLAMRSVGEVRASDIGLLLLFELIACFYVWRRG